MSSEIQIPSLHRESLNRYIEQRIETGGFLRAVLENDLYQAISRADASSLTFLANIVRWLVCHAPDSCWGSKEKVNAWLDGPKQSYGVSMTDQSHIEILYVDGTIAKEELGPIKASRLRAIVGGYLEFVRVWDTNAKKYISMVVNEEGLLLDLPRNENATLVYHANVRENRPNDVIPAGSCIAGNAVVLPVTIEQLDDLIIPD